MNFLKFPSIRDAEQDRRPTEGTPLWNRDFGGQQQYGNVTATLVEGGGQDGGGGTVQDTDVVSADNPYQDPYNQHTTMPAHDDEHDVLLPQCQQQQSQRLQSVDIALQREQTHAEPLSLRQFVLQALVFATIAGNSGFLVGQFSDEEPISFQSLVLPMASLGSILFRNHSLWYTWFAAAYFIWAGFPFADTATDETPFPFAVASGVCCLSLGVANGLLSLTLMKSESFAKQQMEDDGAEEVPSDEDMEDQKIETLVSTIQQHCCIVEIIQQHNMCMMAVYATCNMILVAAIIPIDVDLLSNWAFHGVLLVLVTAAYQDKGNQMSRKLAACIFTGLSLVFSIFLWFVLGARNEAFIIDHFFVIWVSSMGIMAAYCKLPDILLVAAVDQLQFGLCLAVSDPENNNPWPLWLLSVLEVGIVGMLLRKDPPLPDCIRCCIQSESQLQGWFWVFLAASCGCAVYQALIHDSLIQSSAPALITAGEPGENVDLFESIQMVRLYPSDGTIMPKR